MTDKSLDYRLLRAFTWVLGACFVVAIGMVLAASEQRDEARRFRAQFGDISLSCRVVGAGAENDQKSAETRADQGADGGVQ